MKSSSLHRQWLDYPRGKIKAGTACPTCARYVARDVTCEVVIWCRSSLVLVKRAIEPSKGWWSLPGGYLDWDETLQEAVLREVHEEMGLTVDEPELVGVYSSPDRDPDGRQNVGHCYLVKIADKSDDDKDLPTLKLDRQEHAQVAWFGLDQLPEKIAFDHRQMISDCVKKFGLEVKKT